MVAGICYTTIGVALTNAGPTRFVLMGVGLLLIVLALAGMIATQKKQARPARGSLAPGRFC